MLTSMLHTHTRRMCNKCQLKCVFGDLEILTKHKIKIQICHTISVPQTNCEQGLNHYHDMRLYIVSDCNFLNLPFSSM